MIAYRLDITPGELIDGKYRIIQFIGSGNYGDVFKVEDAGGNIFAMKLLRLWELTCDLHEPLVKRFEQEYKTAKIASDYLVHSLDFGIIKGNPYLIMEYCPRGDLAKRSPDIVKHLVQYAHDVLEGLHALHSAGKIHRDMKPENVLIRGNGKAALTDFGVVGEMDKAKRLSETGWWNKRPKQMQGTPLYMSPEMISRTGGGVTYLPTVDLWSFGVMMYELITGGSFPFGNIQTIEELSEYQERAKKEQWDVAKLRQAQNGEDWVYIIGKCLKADYRERYQSALEVLRDMRIMAGNAEQDIVEQHSPRSMNISRLVVTQGESIGAIWHLNGCRRNGCRMLRVGRETMNDIVLPESGCTYVSRCHFTLEKALNGNFWIIRDGQWQKNERRWVTSTNGTYLNATPVPPEGLKLFTGDIITVGEYKLKVE